MNKSKSKIFNYSLFKIKNKRADELLSIWWFIIFGVVGVAIVYGTMTFYSFPLDIRAYEAETISDNLASCIFDNQEAFVSNNLDYFTDCRLNKELFGANSKYFVTVSSDGKTTKIGNPQYEKLCEIKSALKQAKNYPECMEKNFSIFEKGAEYKIGLLVASDNKGVVSNDRD